jgi:hypothetical protein
MSKVRSKFPDQNLLDEGSMFCWMSQSQTPRHFLGLILKSAVTTSWDITEWGFFNEYSK